MFQQASDSAPAAEKPGRKYRRFPRATLSSVLILVDKIYELGKGEPVRRLLVFDSLGRSPSSSTSRMLITTANSGYGLVQGGYNAEFLALTELGHKLATSSNSSEKQQAVYRALFSNEVFSAFVHRFKGKGLPNDQVLVDHLMREHGLSKKDAESCWEVFSQNIHDFGLVRELSGKSVLVSQEMAIDLTQGETPESRHDMTPESQELSDAPLSYPHQLSGGILSPHNAVPQIHFNIQIQIPENASPEVYETIFRNIAIHLLGHTE